MRLAPSSNTALGRRKQALLWVSAHCPERAQAMRPASTARRQRQLARLSQPRL
jgi:hypothetical protein